MKKEYIKYGSITLITLFILIFIYPTIYRYDKFDQKIPLRINRVTGVTEMFNVDGWQVKNDSSKSIAPILNFQSDEIDLKQKELKIGDLVIRKINLSKRDFTAEIINLGKKTIILSSIEAALYDKNGSALVNQPTSKLFYNDLKPNETTVFSMNMGAFPYDSINWDLVDKNNKNNKENPVEIVAYSSYKLNATYLFR